MKTIPKIEVREQRAEDAISLILAQYKNAHPTSVTYDSFIVCSDYSAKKLISLSLANVPLEVALNAVANNLGRRAHYKDNKIIIINDHQIQETYFADKLTDDVLEGLNLVRPISERNLTNALQKAKIDISGINEIKFDDKQEFVRIHMKYNEAQKLWALFELLNRGMRFNHSSGQSQGPQ